MHLARQVHDAGGYGYDDELAKVLPKSDFTRLKKLSKHIAIEEKRRGYFEEISCLRIYDVKAVESSKVGNFHHWRLLGRFAMRARA